MSNEFAKWLEGQLIRHNIFACDLAKELHMSQSTISKYIHEKSMPRYTTVIALCTVLKDDPEWVWKMIRR